MRALAACPLVILCCGPFLLASPICAQSQRSPSSEFLDAVANGTMMFLGQDSVVVTEGSVPRAWAGRLPIPAGARVLGTISSPPFATAYMVLGAPPDSSAAALGRLALAQGWTSLEPTDRPGRPFVNQRDSSPSSEYCRGGKERLVVAPRPRPGGRTLVTLIYIGNGGDGCGPWARDEYFPFSILPALHPPAVPAGRSLTDCMTMRRSSGNGAQVVTTLGAGELLASYGSQLEAAGWRPVADAGETAAGAWWKAGTGGDTTQVLLQVLPVLGRAAACRSVQISVQQK